MLDARARVIALCRRGFAPHAVATWHQPGEPRQPHPVAQRVVDAFLERSAQRYGRPDAFLREVLEDAIDVGVMRAALVYEDGLPAGLRRLDARLAPHLMDVLITEPAADQVERSVDAWERAQPGWRARAQGMLAGTDDWTLAPIIRHLQGRCQWLLSPLLAQVLAAQRVRGALVECRFTDPHHNPPKPKGRPRGPEFMRNDPDWREKAEALIAGRKLGRYWSVLLPEAGVSRSTADKMIEEYEKERRG